MLMIKSVVEILSWLASRMAMLRLSVPTLPRTIRALYPRLKDMIA